MSQQQQPLVVSTFHPRQTGWLQLSPGESAVVTPKTYAMTHTYDHLPQVHLMLSKSLDPPCPTLTCDFISVCSFFLIAHSSQLILHILHISAF